MRHGATAVLFVHLRHVAHAAAAGDPPVVLIAGSLYLAGAVLAANGEPPD